MHAKSTIICLKRWQERWEGYHIVVMIITHFITGPSEANEIFIKSKEIPHVETCCRGDSDHRWR